MHAPPSIELQGLTKVFGRHSALAGVDLAVEQGSVFGFLGPNGAGKTTTLRILTGLARATSGRAAVLTHDVVQAGNQVRALIGYLPDVPGFYNWMTAEQFLHFAGTLFGLRGPLLRERMSALLDMAGLAGVHTRIGGFSRGMKQRLGIAQALINAPRLLLLDEPTSALDPIGRKEVLDMIASLAGRTTVFFSTHILADVERVCDTVAILNHGKVLTVGSVQQLKARAGAECIIVEVDIPEKLESLLSGQPWVRRLDRKNQALYLIPTDAAVAQRALPRCLADSGLALRRMETAEATLEQVFVDIVGQEADG